MVSELKACPNPWCQHVPTEMPVHMKRRGWRVYCDECRVACPYQPTEAEAIAAWNQRSLSGVRELVEALEWCREQANEAMAISAGCATSHGDAGGGLEMVNRIASDIAINLDAALSRFQSDGRDLG